MSANLYQSFLFFSWHHLINMQMLQKYVRNTLTELAVIMIYLYCRAIKEG